MSHKHRTYMIALCVAGIVLPFIWYCLPDAAFKAAKGSEQFPPPASAYMVFMWSTGVLIVLVLAATYMRGPYWVLGGILLPWPLTFLILLIIKTPRLPGKNAEQVLRERRRIRRDLEARAWLVVVMGIILGVLPWFVVAIMTRGLIQVIAKIVAVPYFVGYLFAWRASDHVRAESMAHYLRNAPASEVRASAAFGLAVEPPHITKLAEQALREAMEDQDEEPIVRKWVERAISHGIRRGA